MLTIQIVYQRGINNSRIKGIFEITLNCHMDTDTKTQTKHNTNYQEYFWNWVIDVNCKFKHCSLTTQK